MSERHFEKIGEKDCVLNIIHLFHWPRILNRRQQLRFESDFPVNRLNCFPIFSGSLPEIRAHEVAKPTCIECMFNER